MSNQKRYSAIIQGQKVYVTEADLQRYRAARQQTQPDIVQVPDRTNTPTPRQVHHHHYYDEANTQIKAFFGFLFIFIGIFVAGMGMHALHQEKAARYQPEVQYNGR